MDDSVTIGRLLFAGEDATSTGKSHLQGQILSITKDHLFTQLSSEDGQPVDRWRCDGLRQWYSIEAIHHPTLGKGYLVDLQTPLVKVGAGYECYDLVLDIFLDGGRDYHLLNQERFALAKDCSWLHHVIAERAWLQVADWVTLVKSGNFSAWLYRLKQRQKTEMIRE